MSQSDTLTATFHSIRKIVVSPAGNSLLLTATDRSGQVYEIELPVQTIPPVLMGLIALSGKIRPPETEPSPVQPMILDSGKAFRLDDGRAGLEITVERAIRLPLVFPPEAIPILRSALDKLEEMTRNLPPATAH